MDELRQRNAEFAAMWSLMAKTAGCGPVKDAVALANRMTQLLAMPVADRQAMGMAGRQFVVENFDEQKVVAHYLATLARYGLGNSAA